MLITQIISHHAAFFDEQVWLTMFGSVLVFMVCLHYVNRLLRNERRGSNRPQIDTDYVVRVLMSQGIHHRF